MADLKGIPFNRQSFDQMLDLVTKLNRNKISLLDDGSGGQLSGFAQGFGGFSGSQPRLGRGFATIDRLIQGLLDQSVLDFGKPGRIGSR